MRSPNLQMRLLATVGALFSLSSVDLASKGQIDQAMSVIRLENVRDNRHRGVGPWVLRRPGWRQRQRRKLARRTA